MNCADRLQRDLTERELFQRSVELTPVSMIEETLVEGAPLRNFCHFGFDIDADLHAKFIVGITPIGTRERNSLLRRSRDTNSD